MSLFSKVGSLFSTITSTLSSYLTPILIGFVVVLAAGLGFTFYLYHGEVATNSQLKLLVESQNSTISQLQSQLTDERKAAVELQNQKSAVEKRYAKIYKKLKNLPKSKTLHAIDPDALRQQLCASGLAVKSACGEEN